MTMQMGKLVGRALGVGHSGEALWKDDRDDGGDDDGDRSVPLCGVHRSTLVHSPSLRSRHRNVNHHAAQNRDRPRLRRRERQRKIWRGCTDFQDHSI